MFKLFSKATMTMAMLAVAGSALAQSFSPMFPANEGSQNWGWFQAIIKHIPVTMASNTVTSVKVRVNITSINANAYTLTVKSPNNTSIVISGGGVDNSNFVNTIFWDGAAAPAWTDASPRTGFYQPNNPLSGFNGLNPNGEWQVIMAAGVSEGTFVSAELEINDGVLPVEMSAFTANASDRSVALQWRTESENNNSHFQIYRSTVASDRGEFLARVDGHGTVATANDYRFVDSRVENGTTYYYQIGDVSLDGREVMSSLVVSATPAPNALGEIPIRYTLSQNFPNPFNPTTSITYGIHKAGHVKVVVFDVMGKEVAKLVDGVQSPNTYKVEFDASKLPSGMYYYSLQTANFSTTKKMTLTK